MESLLEALRQMRALAADRENHAEDDEERAYFNGRVTAFDEALAAVKMSDRGNATRPNDRVSSSLQDHGSAAVVGLTLAELVASVEQIGLATDEVELISGTLIVGPKGWSNDD